MVKFWASAKIRFRAFGEGQVFGVWRKSSFGRLVKVIFGRVAKTECGAFGESQVLRV